MHTIENLVELFESLAPASGNRWAVRELFEERLFITRDASGRHSIFLVGDKDSFGRVPRFGGVSYSERVTVMPSGVTLSALRLTTGSLNVGNRVMAHIAYELHRLLESDPPRSNANLLGEVRWVLELLGGQELLLGEEQQRGLVGECVFLRKLLVRARALSRPVADALSCWHGYERGKRDFSGGGVAVEVKFTTSSVRLHSIHGLAQLDPQAGEEVFLFSMGAKVDPGAPRKLPDYVADVLNLLTTPAGEPDKDLQVRFAEALEAVGYVEDAVQVYRGGPGFMHFHLPPKLYREVDLDRVRLQSFKNDRLPSMVVDVSYTIEVGAQPLTDSQEAEVLGRLLAG